MNQFLNTISFPLYGSRLIEASAGTGKTWTIASLYLRLILGHGKENAFRRPLLPKEILVMTFTRAATRELINRIRNRITEAIKSFRGELNIENTDIFLQDLIHNYKSENERKNIAYYLEIANQNINESSIFTIDAWCQKVLKENTFININDIKEDNKFYFEEAVKNYWRCEVYPLDNLEDLPWKNINELIIKLNNKKSNNYLENSINNFKDLNLKKLIAKQNEEKLNITKNLQIIIPKLEFWLDNEIKNKSFDGRLLTQKKYQEWINPIIKWIENPELNLELNKNIERLFPDNLKKISKKDDLNIPKEFNKLENLLSILSSYELNIIKHASLNINIKLKELKLENSINSFDDIQQILYEKIKKDEELKLRILKQYPVIFIDEFQDASKLQYKIFDLIYNIKDNSNNNGIFLIGDPKQSIYSFRNADIESYLNARKNISNRNYILKTNYRSTNSLVNEINKLFNQAEISRENGAFLFKENETNLLPFHEVNSNNLNTSFVDNNKTIPAIELTWYDNIENETNLLPILASSCADKIVNWLNNPNIGFVNNNKFKRLKTNDISILVYNRFQANVLKLELHKRGINSTYISDKNSIFLSQEASDIFLWLKAINNPLNINFLKLALSTQLFNFSLNYLTQIFYDKNILNYYIEQVNLLNSLWQKKGVLTILRQTLYLWDLPNKLVNQSNKERILTNYLHLAEILQESSNNFENQESLIEWLNNQINSNDKEQILRLESDNDLIKIITIHKSKGLEFPIVCLPFNYNSEKIIDINDLRESIRKFYVAVTRPKYHLWIGLSAVKRIGEKKTSAIEWLLNGNNGYKTSEEFFKKIKVLENKEFKISFIDNNKIIKLNKYYDIIENKFLNDTYNKQNKFDWSINSFSSLNYNKNLLNVERENLGENVKKGNQKSVWHDLKYGRSFGNFIHSQMELLSKNGFILNEEKIIKNCELFGYKEQSNEIIFWLNKILNYNLNNINLNKLKNENYFSEMEFYLSLNNFQISILDDLCCKNIFPNKPRPKLFKKNINGMLKGFIDLVFFDNNKYWILDYKTNYLGFNESFYTQEQLQENILKHRYDVQATLYILALHLLLKKRLKNYSINNIGGAIYFFLRGIDNTALKYINPNLKNLEKFIQII